MVFTRYFDQYYFNYLLSFHFLTKKDLKTYLPLFAIYGG